MTMAFGGPLITTILQDNSLQKVFQDAMYPALLFRRDAQRIEFPAAIGESLSRTRTGLMTPALTPLVPGTDPAVGTYGVERWTVNPSQYGLSLDTHMPTSRAALASKFLRDTKTLGLNAGETVNRLARNRLYSAYAAGNANATVIAAIGAFAIHLSTLNGFTTDFVNGVPTAVSAANPLTITFGGAEPANTVVAATPDNAAQPLGPGWITLGAALTVGVAAREAVLAADRSVVYRVGGGNSVDAIGAADILTLQDFTNAVSLLEAQNVPPHADGMYHVHLGPTGRAQVFADNQFQRLHEGIPDSMEYREFIIARKLGCDFYKNNVVPDNNNSGTLITTGAGASFMSPEIGADVINNAGVIVGRAIVTGGEVMTEDYIPENDFTSAEGGVQGRIGNFSVTNAGVFVDTNGIRYILRAPQDRAQQMYAQTWTMSADWGVPTDALTGGAARAKRAIILEHAIG